MHESAFVEALKTICERDPRYDAEAYFFVRESLDYTAKLYNKPQTGSRRHVTAAQLLEGIRQYALKQFGPMALSVLRSWGVESTADLGSLVFNLVDHGVLGKTDDDRLEDFVGAYEFADVFRKPFLPEPRDRSEGAVHERRRGRRGRKRTKSDTRSDQASGKANKLG